MKKTLAIVLTLTLLFSLFPMAVPVKAWGMTGICGENLTFYLDRSISALTISGTGPMYDYSEENPAPWAGSNNWAGTCVIESGVTSIGDFAFGKQELPMKVCIPDTVTQIGAKAFSNNHFWVTFLGSAPQIASDAFENATATCHYITGWEESRLQGYGGELVWEKAVLKQTGLNKLLYTVNTPIKPEDFVFKAECGDQTYQYIPKSVETAPYDNSVSGEKSVEVTADGFTFTHEYIVTDGLAYLDQVKVELPAYRYYTGKEICPEVKVSVGNFSLTKDVHYSVTYTDNIHAGANAQVLITGLDEWSDMSVSRTFRILRRDLSYASAYASNQEYQGLYQTPEPEMYTASGKPILGEDYFVLYENNLNKGTASYHAVGFGDNYGSATGTFEIGVAPEYHMLQGSYNGQADGELNTDVYTEVKIINPGPFEGRINNQVGNYHHRHYAYYELYHVEDEELILVTTLETEYGYNEKTAFKYDFSHVYEGSVETGGEVYVLAYTWVNSQSQVYTGACTLVVCAKVPAATEMAVEQAVDSDDFRKAYFVAYGLDGDIGKAEWSSSDPAVAEVQGGIVTLKTPGTVMITACSGELCGSAELTVPQLDIAQSELVDCNVETGEVLLSYENIPLIAGTDYLVSFRRSEGTQEWIITGIGLFTGERAVPMGEGAQWHSHSYDYCYDTVCDECGLLRKESHVLPEAWLYNEECHWQNCEVCGNQVGVSRHTGDGVCSVCGSTALLPGDVNGDGNVNNRDATRLLQYLAGWSVEVEEALLDINGDGKVNNRDVTRLLQYLAGWDVDIFGG